MWGKILGVLLVLLGLTLLVSPRITYTSHEKIPHSRFTVKREKTVVVPPSAAVLTIGAGVAALVFANRRAKE